jgi:hypothetical protein
MSTIADHTCPMHLLEPPQTVGGTLERCMTKKTNQPGRPAGAKQRIELTHPVHPIADLFPMMTDEELANLAADIKANGLIHPVVLDKNGVLLDGRNRDRACQIAGIEPTTVLFEGDDPRAFIIGNNINRRHLTKGQQAMAVAMVYPVPEKGGKGKRSRIQEGLDEPRKTFQNRLSQARIVFAYSPDLAQAVLAGSKFLDAAYDEARKAKQLLDVQVAGNVRRKVARSKKVAVLPGNACTSPDKGREIDALAKLPAAEKQSLAEATKGGKKGSAVTAHNAPETGAVPEVIPDREQPQADNRDVAAAEAHARWLSRYEAVKARQAALAQELEALYRPFQAIMVELLHRIEDVDEEARRVNDAKPFTSNGDGRLLGNTESVARAPAGLSIVKDLKLPAWEGNSIPAWPPQQLLPLQIAASMGSRSAAEELNYAIAREASRRQHQAAEARAAEEKLRREIERRRGG